ncbi:response regulator [Xanthobacter sp. DSM 24535]|uniref:response regulator n=1 Tax=Roseixanthobacter psychrophilus TaxID=3119917 RepID=UPI0037290C9A
MAPQRVVAIIDDDGSSLAALVSLVDAFGFSARGFRDPRDFLASPAAREATCLIIDVRMPGMSAAALRRELQMAGLDPPTILVTAYPAEASRASALEAGIAAYLPKPVIPDELLALLRDLAR